MNYEDDPALLPPQQVVSQETLARLRRPIEEAIRLLHETVGTRPGVGSPAYEAIILRAREEAQIPGAPPGTFAVVEMAMLSGYVFGQALLPSSQACVPVSPLTLRERADAMYLYGLLGFVGGDKSREFDVRCSRLIQDVTTSVNQVKDPSMFEEEVNWAWAFGLGIAVVEVDLATAS
jgi:hypothetical protein